MFKTVDETVAYLREFCALAAGVTGAEIVSRAVHGTSGGG